MMNDMKMFPRLDLELIDFSHQVSDMFESNQKALIPVRILGNKLVVRVALLTEKKMEKLTFGEKYSGFDGDIIFVNKTISAPRGTLRILPQLMVLHALVSICEVNIHCQDLRREKYLPIRIEMLYAKRLLSPMDYQEYVEWRKGKERSIFFEHPGWERMLASMEEKYFDILKKIVEVAPNHPAVKPTVAAWKKELGPIAVVKPPLPRRRRKPRKLK